jgi:hypothetical protein
MNLGAYALVLKVCSIFTPWVQHEVFSLQNHIKDVLLEAYHAIEQELNWQACTQGLQCSQHTLEGNT